MTWAVYFIVGMFIIANIIHNRGCKKGASPKRRNIPVPCISTLPKLYADCQIFHYNGKHCNDGLSHITSCKSKHFPAWTCNVTTSDAVSAAVLGFNNTYTYLHTYLNNIMCYLSVIDKKNLSLSYFQTLTFW